MSRPLGSGVCDRALDLRTFGDWASCGVCFRGQVDRAYFEEFDHGLICVCGGPAWGLLTPRRVRPLVIVLHSDESIHLVAVHQDAYRFLRPLCERLGEQDLMHPRLACRRSQIIKVTEPCEDLAVFALQTRKCPAHSDARVTRRRSRSPRSPRSPPLCLIDERATARTCHLLCSISAR